MQQRRQWPVAVVVMGVSGAGKSSVGRHLAERLCWSFVEGDELHPVENVAKMRSGHPLTDADRAPWLAAIAAVIDRWRRCCEHGVVTCSALKRSYRWQIIGDRSDIRLIHLAGSRQLIAARLAVRRGHFMPASLLASQFATLEPPGPEEDPIIICIDQPPDGIVERIVGILLSSPLRSASSCCNLRGTQ